MKLKTTLIALGLIIASPVFAQTWSAPSQTPPGGNVETPLNVSATAQSKIGGAIFNTGGAAYGLLVPLGSVGIGTLTPLAKLHISDTSANAPQIFVENTSTYGIKFGLNTSNVGFLGSTNATPVQIQTAGVSRIYADTTGNVGIGTASPGAKLEVAGQVKITGGSAGTGKVLQSDSTGLASWVATSSLGFSGGGVTSVAGGTGITASPSSGAVSLTNTGVISNSCSSGISCAGTNPSTFTNTGVTSLVAGSGISVSGATGAVTVTATGGGGTVTNSASSVGFIPKFTTATNITNSLLSDNGSAVNLNGNMTFTPANPTITASSYVTIPNGAYLSSGTLYTEAPIQARGGVHSDTTSTLNLTGGTSGNTYVSGKLGVGTNGPVGMLHVKGSGNQPLTIDRSDAGGASNSLIMLRDEGGVNRFAINIDSAANNGVTEFWDASGGSFTSPDMSFKLGNVGIGNVAPAHKLDVTGNIGLSASSYLNFGATDGTGGYGVRDNAGTLQYKNNGGAWTNFGGGSGTITGVTAGTGLSGGGVSGTVTLNNTGVTSVTAGSGISVSGSTGSVTISATGGGTVTSISPGTGMSFSANPITTTGTINADTNYLQRRVSGTCPTSNFISTVNADGSVGCSPYSNFPLNLITFPHDTTNNPTWGETRLTSDNGILTFNLGWGMGQPAQVYFKRTDGVANYLNVNVDGTIFARAYMYTSDATLKKNIKALGSQNSLDKITKLQGVSFDWKTGDTNNIGLIAQDVEKVYPELVKTDKTTGLKSVEYGNLVAPLIEAVKAQQKQIDELKAEVESLKANK